MFYLFGIFLDFFLEFGGNIPYFPFRKGPPLAPRVPKNPYKHKSLKLTSMRKTGGMTLAQNCRGRIGGLLSAQSSAKQPGGIKMSQQDFS